MPRIEIADRVYHRPSGETWLVAYADYKSGDISWLGWPEGRARISECEIVDKATKERRLYWATQLERSTLPRADVARRLYPDLFDEVRAALSETALKSDAESPPQETAAFP